MKVKTQTRQAQSIRELLGLAVIGFVLWLAAIGWLPVSLANAAPGAHHHADPEKRLARIQKQLNLTDDQMDRIRPILENLAIRRRALFENDQIQNCRRMRAEMRKLREEADTALTDVLTDEQMAKWQQLRDERRRERLKRRSTSPHR